MKNIYSKNYSYIRYLVFLGLVCIPLLGMTQTKTLHSRKAKTDQRRSPSASTSTAKEGGCVEAPYTFGDPIYEQVIQADSYCCDNEWDEVCQYQYDAIANSHGNTTCQNAMAAVEGLNEADGPLFGAGATPGHGATNANWFVYYAESAGTLDISSCFGGADTRLWVYESPVNNCDNLTLIAYNDDYCEYEYGSEAYAAFASVYACEGKYYYIEWDDFWSNQKFRFSLTFTPNNGTDLGITNTQSGEYTSLPDIAGDMSYSIHYMNMGNTDMNNIKSKTDVYKNNSLLLTRTEDLLPSFPMCGKDTISVNISTRDFANYSTIVNIYGSNTETNTGNNVFEYNYKIDTVFARDNGIMRVAYIVDDSGYVLTKYHLPVGGKLTSVSFLLSGADVSTNGHTKVDVFNQNEEGYPGQIIGSTGRITYTPEMASDWITAPISGGLVLPEGDFFIGILESADCPVPLGYSDSICTPGTGFISFGENGFDPLEWSTPGLTPMLRANFKSNQQGIEAIKKTDNICIQPNPGNGEFNIITQHINGAVNLTLIDNRGNVVHREHYRQWQSPTRLNLKNMAAGLYTLIITNSEKTFTKKIIISR